MENIFFKKMIQNCFYQYHYTKESLPLSEEDYEQLLANIEQARKEYPAIDLHEIVEDVVYEFLTTS
ncbi:YqzH family protein [Microbacteriaceae bacterium 4G12]